MRLGDLDALKEDFKRIYRCAETAEQLANNMEDAIDNAPTVETDIEVVAKDAYKQGYTDGWKERFGEPNERPQGEWIKVTKAGTVPVEYICSLCRRKIYDNYELTTPIDEFYPFCHCGADMRKGGAE